MQLGRRVRRLWARDPGLAALATAFWLAWAALSRSRLFGPDGVGYYAYAQSLVLDFDLSIEREFARFGVALDFSTLTERGFVRSFFGIGCGLLWLPFVAVAHACALLGKMLGANLRADGTDSVYVSALTFGTAVYGLFALGLSYRLAERFTSRRPALLATAAIATLSSFWHYVFFDASLAHVNGAFAVALLLWLLDRQVHAPRTAPAERLGARTGWLLVGLAAGLTAVVRFQHAVFVFALALALGYDALRSAYRARFGGTGPVAGRWDERPLLALALLGCGAALASLPQLIVFCLEFGRPIGLPHGTRFFDPMHPALFSVLVSSHHGLFSWTPIAFFACLGLALPNARGHALGRFVAGCLLAEIYLGSVVLDPGAGISFGARRLSDLAPIFVFGLAALFARVPRWVALATVSMAALWTFPLWLAYANGLIEPMLYVSFEQMTRAIIAALAALPRIVGAAQFDRFGFGAQPWLLSAVETLLVVGAIAAATALALRARGSRPAPARLQIALALALSSLLDIGVAAAAFRSRPAPADAHVAEGAAMIDFGWYANSRYDKDPFEPRANLWVGAPLTGAPLRWGHVRFEILPPPEDARTAPSNATNCFIESPLLELDLPRRNARALHLALAAGYALEPNAEVARVTVRYTDGGSLSRTLRAGVDVWDARVAVAADKRIEYAPSQTLAGYTLALDPTRVPERLLIEHAGRGSIACIALFSVTLERSEATLGDAERFVPVAIAPIANADYSRNPYRALFIFNHFPDLSPGLLHVAGIPFLILDRHRTRHGNTALTLAYQPGFRMRIPLGPLRSQKLCLLLDGASMLNTPPFRVADLMVEYASGPAQSRELWAGRDVRDYWLPLPEGQPGWRGRGLEDLTYLELPLDPSRTPADLWLDSVPNRGSNGSSAGIAIFAISQKLALSGPTNASR